MTPSASCGLASLADPRLAGIAPGLFLSPGELAQVDRRALACCEGNGMRLATDAELTVACDLNARLRRVRVLVRAWVKQTGSEVSPTLTVDAARASELAAAIRRLAEIAGGQSRRGLAFGARAGEPDPLSVWMLAIAAAWRFGLAPHVVMLGQSGVPVFPKPAPGEHTVLLLGGIKGLWDPVNAEVVDALVSYAYRSLTPLFLCFERFDGGGDAGSAVKYGTVPGPRNTRKAFGSVIAGLKSKSPLSWLLPDCAAKLPAVTDGLASLGMGAGRGGAGAKAAKLPWET